MQRPFAAYEGNDSYTFVCYCHDDAARVYPEIERLHEAGLNVWYDEGVSPGTEWSESLASHIQRCAVFLYFITPRSVEREQCRQELNFALNQGRRILAVHLEQTQLPPALQLILSHRQAILKYEYPRRAYDEKLARALAGAADDSEPSSPVRDQTTVTSSGLRGYLKFGALAFALLLAVGTTWWFRGSELDEPTVQAPVMSDIGERPRSIAVLPLRNVSGDEDQAYFGEAVSSEIWAKLTRLRGLRVISMTSSSAYRQSDLDIREIGRRLGADLVIEGTAMRSGNLTRVNIHLTNARDGTEVWGQPFTESIAQAGDLFALYDDIAAAIGESLPSHVQGAGALNVSGAAPTENVAAYNLLKQAEYENAVTGDPTKPLRLAQQAAALDPEYADAHAAVAGFLVFQADLGYAPPRELLVRAESAALRALAIDPNQAAANLILGFIYDRLYLDWAQAMRAYEKAEALGAHPDMLAAWKMDLLLNSGNYERGLSLATDARARNPGHGAWLVHMGRFLYRMGRIEEARRKFEEGLRLSPRHVWVVFVVIQHFLLMGDLDRAEDAYNTYVAPIPDFVQYWPGDALRGRLSLARGNPVPLQSIVVDWVGSRDKNHVPAWAISDILYSLSRYEDHIHWFAVRVEERDLLSWVMDELRQRPQYREELLNWARSNPEHVTERVQVVDEHLSLVDRVTDNMVL